MQFFKLHWLFIDVTVRFINATTLSPVTMYSVHENEEVLSVCVEVVGVSRKDVSLTLSTLDGTATGVNS